MNLKNSSKKKYLKESIQAFPMQAGSAGMKTKQFYSTWHKIYACRERRPEKAEANKLAAGLTGCKAKAEVNQ
jgi:hypothetical protein